MIANAPLIEQFWHGNFYDVPAPDWIVVRGGRLECDLAVVQAWIGPGAYIVLRDIPGGGLVAELTVRIGWLGLFRKFVWVPETEDAVLYRRQHIDRYVEAWFLTEDKPEVSDGQ